jgi:hypothetical protein
MITQTRQDLISGDDPSSIGSKRAQSKNKRAYSIQQRPENREQKSREKRGTAKNLVSGDGPSSTEGHHHRGHEPGQLADGGRLTGTTDKREDESC